MAERKFQVGVKALIRNKKGEILLLKANEKKFVVGGEAYWDLPGGRIRESRIEETLRREVEEETGIKNLKILDIFDASISNIKKFTEDDVGWMLLVYNCGIAKEKITLSEEHTEYKWFVPKEAAKLLAHKYPESFTKKIK